MVVIFWACKPISFEHVSFWCMLLESHLSTYHSSISVLIRKTNNWIRVVYCISQTLVSFGLLRVNWFLCWLFCQFTILEWIWKPCFNFFLDHISTSHKNYKLTFLWKLIIVIHAHVFVLGNAHLGQAPSFFWWDLAILEYRVMLFAFIYIYIWSRECKPQVICHTC